jgi:hypothetical protein
MPGTVRIASWSEFGPRLILDLVAGDDDVAALPVVVIARVGRRFGIVARQRGVAGEGADAGQRQKGGLGDGAGGVVASHSYLPCREFAIESRSQCQRYCE